MKRKKNLVLLTVSTLLSFNFLNLISLPLLAQTPFPSIPPLKQPTFNNNNNNSLDDLPNDPQQLRSWKCTQNNNIIEVEAKDVPVWKSLIEGDGWQCKEQVSDLPVGNLKFSCEPDEIIGILTITWLKGKDGDGQKQLDSWMNYLTTKEGMICKSSTVTPFGGEK